MSKKDGSKFQIGEVVLLPNKRRATIVKTWWDGEQFRHEVTTRQGLWIYLETSLAKFEERCTK